MVDLLINGRTHQVDVPDDMPLLWVLRDVLSMNGTKFGCGIAQCGACTVHVGAKPVRSCFLPTGAVGSQPVITIEAIHIRHPFTGAYTNRELAALANYTTTQFGLRAGRGTPEQIGKQRDLTATAVGKLPQ